MTAFVKSSKRGDSCNSRSVKEKLNNFEAKYADFINNYSSYIKTSESSYLSRVKFVSQRGTSRDSDVLKENSKLRRQNEILMKTLEEINKQEREKIASKESLENLAMKEKIQKSEETGLKVQKLVEARLKEKESGGERKISMSPPGKVYFAGKLVYKERNFTPIARNSVSPVYKTATEKSRIKHSLKKVLKNTQEELEKVKNERDQLRVYQKLSIQNPPVPFSLALVSSQYETEVLKCQTINGILQQTIERLSRLIKQYIKDSIELIPLKKVKELDSLKTKIMDAIQDSCEIKTKIVENRGKGIKSSLGRGNEIVGSGKIGQDGKEEIFRQYSSAPITTEGFYDSRGNFSGSEMDNEGILLWNDLILKGFSNVSEKFLGFLGKVDRMNGVIERFKEIFRKIFEENKELKKKNEGLSKKSEDFSGNESKNSEIMEYEEKIKGLELKVTEKNHEIQDIRKEFTQKSSEIKRLVEKIEMNKIELGKSGNIIQELKKKVKGLEDLIVNYIKEIEERKAQFKTLNENYERINKEKDRFKGELEKQKKTMEQEIGRVKKEIEMKFKAKEGEINEYKKILVEDQEKYEQIIYDKNEEIQKHQKMLQDNKNELEILTNEKQELEKAFGAWEEEKEKLLNTIKKTSEEADHFKVKIQDLNDENQELNKKTVETEIYMKMIEDAKAEIIQKEEILKASESQISKFKEEISNLNKLLQEKTKSFEIELIQHKENLSKALEEKTGSPKSSSESSLSQLPTTFSPLSPSQTTSPTKITTLSLCFESSFTAPSSSSLLSSLQKTISEFLTPLSEAFSHPIQLSDSQTIINKFQDSQNLSSHLQATLSQTQEILTLKSSEISDLTTKIIEIEMKLLESSSNLYSTNESLQKALSKNSSLETQLHNLKEDLSSLQDYYDSLYSEKGKLLTQCEELKNSETELRKRLLSEQSISQDLEDSLEKLSEALNQSKAELELTVTSHEAFKEDSSKEINILKEYILSLEVLKESLEATNSQLETRTKDVLLKKQAEFSESIKSFQEQRQTLIQLNTVLQNTIETQQASIAEHKNQIQTLEIALENSAATIKNLKQRPKLSICLEFCDTIFTQIRNSESATMSPVNFSSPMFSEDIPEIVLSSTVQKQDMDTSSNLNSLLLEIEFLIQNQVPDMLLNWCQKIMTLGNYVLRYHSNDESMVSEESRVDVDRFEIGSVDDSQELQNKGVQINKVIEELVGKLKDKKERLRLSKLNIKTLQSEIRRLDNKIKQEGSIDLEYLKVSVINFVKGLKKIDGDSMKCLQIIQAQLGIKTEVQSPGKKWGIFSKKN